MSPRERDRVKVLHEVQKGQLSQKQAAGQLGLTDRWVRKLLQRLLNVTANPTSESTAQQTVGALAWDRVPRYLLRDRDSIHGESFRERVRGMGIGEVLTAPRAPWQNPYIEHLLDSIRRECLDQLIVFNEFSLRRILKSYFEYYRHSRTHLALAENAPEPRAIQSPELGAVIEIPEVGGLHHRYERRAA